MSKQKNKPDASEGRFAYEGLDRLMHERARLGIMISLVTRPEGIRYGELKQLCALTDGNIARHVEALREAGLVECWKGFENRRPQTLYRLSPNGRKRFLEYLGELERVIADAVPAAARAVKKGAVALPELPFGWVPG